MTNLMFMTSILMVLIASFLLYVKAPQGILGWLFGRGPILGGILWAITCHILIPMPAAAVLGDLCFFLMYIIWVKIQKRPTYSFFGHKLVRKAQYPNSPIHKEA